MIRAAALTAVIAATGAAAPAPSPGPVTEPGGASTHDFRIETDQTNSNLNDGNFTMPHRVKFLRPGTDVVGDRAKGNYKAGTVTISGHVVLHDNGQAAEAQQAGAPGGGPATLTCDELQVDSKRKIYVATGNVVYVQGTRRATAQNGRLDQGAHALDLSGDVHLADGDQTLTAQNVHYNTLTKDVNTSGNPVIMSAPASPPAPGTTSTLPTPAAKASPKPK
jgi:lipopolysaccharide assembly outer membrane protein LptD (OstA)